jgi:4-hydroxy-3-methylbut-2-enyl diphosphate reductase
MTKVIAIDGPSGAGKSTLARLLASSRGMAYLDTGALYRTVALALLREGLGENATDTEISAALEHEKVEFIDGSVFLNGVDVSEEIRSPEAGHYASVFSARAPVRAYLLGIQRDAAASSDLVAEGRDMTTVVFPDAYRKFFLDASVEERVGRRTRELLSRGFPVDDEQIRREIVERDMRDSQREIAPLRRAADAYVIDSTGLAVEDVLRKMEAVLDGTLSGDEDRNDCGLDIVSARRAGFCFGVKRAIDIAFAKAEKDPEGVYTLGPIIHNPQVIERLKEEGVTAISADEIDRDGIKTLIIRTHGIPCGLYDTISARGLSVIDATCPFVKKAQRYAKLLKEDGYQVVIVGDRNHPEVIGLMSFAGDDVLVVDDTIVPKALKTKVGVVVQTTQPVETLKKVLAYIVEHAKEIKVYNTICDSTALRLKETEEMARSVDVMVVVGGRNSANTTQLANLCRSLGVATHHIETAAEIREGWVRDAKRVGITAGASTPDWIIQDVEKRIRDIGRRSCNGH